MRVAQSIPYEQLDKHDQVAGRKTKTKRFKNEEVEKRSKKGRTSLLAEAERFRVSRGHFELIVLGRRDGSR